MELLSRKFGFGVTNLSSYRIHLAAFRLLKKSKLGPVILTWQNQPLILFTPVKSSKKLAGRFFKLNTDGSRLKNGSASAGGLVRDCSVYVAVWTWKWALVFGRWLLQNYGVFFKFFVLLGIVVFVAWLQRWIANMYPKLFLL